VTELKRIARKVVISTDMQYNPHYENQEGDVVLD
jgi:hypothetical protein